MLVQRTVMVSLTAALALIVGGCASGATTTADTGEASPTEAPAASADAAATPDGHDEDVAADDEHTDEATEPDGHAAEAFTFGEPADSADADRTVKVRATDQMRFEPATVQVHDGEVVTFEVTNVGKIPHDFTLGDQAAQDQHASEMAEAGAEAAHGEPNVVVVAPGETAALTWRFHESGEVLYGCHQPGHYDAGMVGTVDMAP